jgi:hypothetical protein
MTTTSVWLIKYKDYERFSEIINKLDLTEVQKDIIRARYLPILHTFQRRATSYSRIYFSGHILMTLGSLFVPALLSIQYADTGTVLSGISFQVQIFWSTWVLSLLVTICNAILILFKIDKKYYFLNSTLERLRSEGWQYVQLTGKYSGHLINHTTPTHDNQFIYFCHAIERIKMKQVNEEYYKNMEKDSQQPANNQSGGDNKSTQLANDMYVPSPDKELDHLKTAMPDVIEKALRSLITSNRTIETSKQQDIVQSRKNSISSVKSSNTLSSYLSEMTMGTVVHTSNINKNKTEENTNKVIEVIDGEGDKNEIILVNSDNIEKDSMYSNDFIYKK